MSMENQHLEAHRLRVEEWLRNCFQDREPRGDLYDAMRYSLLAGGKRIRPVLLLETCRICGGDPEAALPFAGAIEMIHTYSPVSYTHLDVYKRQVPEYVTVFGTLTAEEQAKLAREIEADFAIPSERQYYKSCLLYTSRCV